MRPDWSKMLPEMLELISDRLPLGDFIAFRGVCRRWRLSPSGRSNIFKFSRRKPWIMIYGSTGEKCYFYCDSHPDPGVFYLPHLQGATVVESKFGWLIARRGEHFFLYNCFTLAMVNLPDHALAEDQLCTFTTMPTRSDCVAFIVSRKCDSNVELSSCRVGDGRWEVETVSLSKDVVGTMLSVHCCSCSCDGSRCDCGLKNSIGIYGLEKYAYYDYVGKKVTLTRRKDKKLKGESCWWGKAKANKGKDWLRRFGKEGIKMSTCAHSYRTDGVVGECRWQYIHSTGDDAQLKIVQAAAVDLKFKEWGYF